MPPRSYWGNCVESAQFATDRSLEVWGYAGNMRPDTDDWIEAQFILTTEGGGHVVTIASQSDESALVLDCNGAAGPVCVWRELPKSSRLIRGLKK